MHKVSGFTLLMMHIYQELFLVKGLGSVTKGCVKLLKIVFNSCSIYLRHLCVPMDVSLVGQFHVELWLVKDNVTLTIVLISVICL